MGMRTVFCLSVFITSTHEASTLHLLKIRLLEPAAPVRSYLAVRVPPVAPVRPVRPLVHNPIGLVFEYRWYDPWLVIS